MDWSELGVSGLLPTGTVTLLLADVEGSTRLWETQPERDDGGHRTARIRWCRDVIAATTACARSSRVRATASWRRSPAPPMRWRCALELQRAPLAPIRLRIGVHTGEIQLRDEGNYAGPTINRTARLRDLGHGGQTLLSGATEALVVDRLPAGAWLTDLGTHPLRDLPRPERVVQLCHPDLVNEFPPLRVSNSRCFPASSGAADQLRGPRRGADPAAGAAGAEPAGDVDRCRRSGQNPAGDPGRGRNGRRVRRRGLVCGSGADHRPRAGAGHRGARTRAARPARPLHHGHA